MKFLGPATQLDGEWVRPHDLVVHRHPGRGDHAGTVARVTHLGFEVRVDVTMDRGEPAWVQLSRGAANELQLSPGDRVWIARAGASAAPTGPAGPAGDGDGIDGGDAVAVGSTPDDLAPDDLAPTTT